MEGSFLMAHDVDVEQADETRGAGAAIVLASCPLRRPCQRRTVSSLMFNLGMGDSSIHRQVKPGEDAADWQAAPSGYHIGSTRGRKQWFPPV